MSTINVSCVDQVLTYTNMPVVSSGGVNADKIKFTFCSLWTGYTKVCVFYRQKGEYYFGVIDGNNEVVIPSQLLVEEGTVNFAVSGYSGTTVRTSTVLSYDIVEGAYTAVTAEDSAYINFTTLVNDVTSLKTQITEKEVKTNKVTSIGSDSTDTQYPSAKCVYDAIQSTGINSCAYVIDGTLSESATENITLDSDITANLIEAAVSSGDVVILRLSGSSASSGYRLYALTEYKFGTTQGEWKTKFGSIYGVDSSYAEITKNTENVLVATGYSAQCVKSDDIVTTVSENSTDTQVPSAKSIYDSFVIIQDNLDDLDTDIGELEEQVSHDKISHESVYPSTQQLLALMYTESPTFFYEGATSGSAIQGHTYKITKTDDTYSIADVTAIGADVSGKEDKTNKVTSVSSASTDSQYPSAKCVYDLVGNVESLLEALL